MLEFPNIVHEYAHVRPPHPSNVNGPNEPALTRARPSPAAPRLSDAPGPGAGIRPGPLDVADGRQPRVRRRVLGQALGVLGVYL